MEQLFYPEEIIVEVARVTLENAREHITALAQFGYNESTLQEFDAAILECEQLPGEIAHREKVKEQTRQKNQRLSNCFEWGRGLQNRFEIVFGKKSPEYNSFPIQEFKKAKKSEIVMLGIFDMIIELAEKHQAKLATAGQTPAIIQHGKELNQQLRDANIAQEVKKDERHAATQARRQKFSAIYDTTNKINKIGRLVFKHDPVKRVLFKSKWPKKRYHTDTATPPAA